MEPKRGVKFADDSSDEEDGRMSVQIHQRDSMRGMPAPDTMGGGGGGGMKRVTSGASIASMTAQTTVLTTSALATPHLTHEQLKYKRVAERSAQVVAPASRPDAPDVDDSLRRVSVVLLQHIHRGEREARGLNASDRTPPRPARPAALAAAHRQAASLPAASLAGAWGSGAGAAAGGGGHGGSASMQFPAASGGGGPGGVGGGSASSVVIPVVTEGVEEGGDDDHDAGGARGWDDASDGAGSWVDDEEEWTAGAEAYPAAAAAAGLKLAHATRGGGGGAPASPYAAGGPGAWGGGGAAPAPPGDVGGLASVLSSDYGWAGLLKRISAHVRTSVVAACCTSRRAAAGDGAAGATGKGASRRGGGKAGGGAAYDSDLDSSDDEYTEEQRKRKFGSALAYAPPGGTYGGSINSGGAAAAALLVGGAVDEPPSPAAAARPSFTQLYDEEVSIDDFHEARYLRAAYEVTTHSAPSMATALSVPESGVTVAKLRYVLEVPTSTMIYDFMKALFTRAKLTAESGIICLVYVERLMESTRVGLRAHNWRPIVLCGLLLASKVWDDLNTWSVEFSAIYPQYTVHAINTMERLFVSRIGFNLFISGSVYAKYYFALRALNEQRSFRQRYNNMVGAGVTAPVAVTKRIEESSKAAASLYSRSL